MSLAVAAFAAAVAWGPLRGEPHDEAYFRNDLASVTAGVQCHYADGSKAIVLRTRNLHRQVLVVRRPYAAYRLGDGRVEPSGYTDTLVLLEFDRGGDYRFEANGGVTTYHMIRLAADHLVKQPYLPLTPKTLDGFLRATNVPKCRRATYDADLYDNR